MYEKKTFLAIIPARGGSKRLPRKNVLNLNGKPLIVWSIEAAKMSQYIDDIVVSSDDQFILSIAQKLKVNTVKRSKHLASDTAQTFDAVTEVLKGLEREYEYIILLQPTSPLRDARHIDEAIELLVSRDADAVVSVCEMEHSPLWSNTLDETLSMEGFLKEEVLNKRSQDLQKYYRLNGAIYICKTEKLLQEESFLLKKNVYAYIMDREHSVDIDVPLDFQIAEVLFSRL